MTVFIESQPWRDDFSIRIAVPAGRSTMYARALGANGRIVWDSCDAHDEIPVFMRVDRSVLEDIAKAIGTHIPEAAASVEALKDARSTRDRLLALVERAAAHEFPAPKPTEHGGTNG